MDRLDDWERQVVALWRLEADGYNGGFLQFYCNWGEDNYKLAANALIEIGANHTFEILSKIRAILTRIHDLPGDHSYSELPGLLTEDERYEIWSQLEPKLWGAAEEIEPLAARKFLPPFIDANR